ncbi:hypothetical protein HOLleu_21974 [Holothuria leucospilota]|uniref:Ig-like domain-containing protein n=1 Tax=Holothuria leucospilota TaxID=206669 RepID=A0A9Q1BYI2_HOLLE|nr:hypothetical protein HOLleu_21974 [Holothuria leucospilota]
MKLYTSTTSYSLFVAATLLITSDGFAKTMCPEIAIVEKGETANVTCDTTGKEMKLVYWYRGDPAISSPILRLENGQPGGTEYGKGHYSITSCGGMIITNATIKHEAVYTALMYFQDETRESMDIKVNVTISPWHSCPVINGCIPCEECSLDVNDTGKLTCNIYGARPMIPLKWTIESQEGVRILEHPRIAVNDITSDTWNSSVEVSYHVSSCSQEAILQCEAEDTFKLLSLSQTSVRVYTENCTNGSLSIIPAKPSNSIIIVLGFCGSIFVILTMFLFVNIYLKVRRRSTPANGFETNSLGEVPPLSPSKVLDADAQKLASSLKGKYKTSRLFDSLPNGGDMTAAKLFDVCNFKVIHTNREISVLPANKLLKSNGIRNESRVLITGGPRYWKTMFTKQFVQKWTDAQTNDFILLYIAKSEVKANVNLIDFLEQETSIDRELVAKGMKNSKCILFLDGLDNIAFDENETKNEQKEPLYKNDKTISKAGLLAHITLSDLLKKSHETPFSHIQIWVTTWHKDTIDGICTSLYAKVYISEVENEQQFNELVKKVYEQYHYSGKQLLPEEHNTGSFGDGVNTESITHTVGFKNDQSTVTFKSNNPIGTREEEFPERQSFNEIGEAEKLLCDETKAKESNQREIDDNVRQHVNKFLRRNQIYQEFKETPFLLSLMVLIIVEKYLTEHCDYDDLDTTTLEELIYIAIRHLHEAHYVINEHKVPLETCQIDSSLGKVAFQLISTKSEDMDIHSQIVNDCGHNLNEAIEMGLIHILKCNPDKQPEEEGTGLSPSYCVKFSNVYFMFYFAANFIVENEKYYEALAEYDKSKSGSILKFLIHLEKSRLKHLVGALRQLKMDDDVFDCLSKWETSGDVEEILKSFGETEIQVCGLDRPKHRSAFTSFLTKCIGMKIKLGSLVITGNISVSILTSLELPVISILTLCELKVQEEDFVSILEWLSKREMTLRFQKCEIPKELSDDVKRNMGTLEDIKVKTIRQGDVADTAGTFLFNYKTGTWTKEETPIAKKIKDNLPSKTNIKKVFASFQK